MRSATITPRSDGTAVLEQNGIPQLFRSYREAADEAFARGVTFRVARFPATPVITDEAPALRVLD